MKYSPELRARLLSQYLPNDQDNIILALALSIVKRLIGGFFQEQRLARARK